jgi:hypothetical protein
VKPISLARGQIFEFFSRLAQAVRAIAVIILISTVLSGCLKYDLGVNFKGTNNGEIVQHVRLDNKLTDFNEPQAKTWLNSLEKRARNLQGRTKRVSDREVTVTIPFNTAKELETKLNSFFNPVNNTNAQPSGDMNIPTFSSQFKVSQSNFLLFVRNKLSYEIDLRSLGVLSDSGNIVLSPDSVADLNFIVNSPSQPKPINRGNKIAVAETSPHQVVWHLKPGEINRVETAFWLPSPLGIGTIIIALITLGGFYLKYKRLPFNAGKS